MQRRCMNALCRGAAAVVGHNVRGILVSFPPIASDDSQLCRNRTELLRPLGLGTKRSLIVFEMSPSEAFTSALEQRWSVRGGVPPAFQPLQGSQQC